MGLDERHVAQEIAQQCHPGSPQDAADDVERQEDRIAHVETPARTGVKVRTIGTNRARMMVFGTVAFKERVRPVT